MNEYGGGWCPFTLLARALEPLIRIAVAGVLFVWNNTDSRILENDRTGGAIF